MKTCRNYCYKARRPWLSYLGSSHRERVCPLFDSESDKAEQEGVITDPEEISNDLEEQQERCQAAQLQGASEVTKPYSLVYPRSGSPTFLENLRAPRSRNHGRASRGVYVRFLVRNEPLFVEDIEAARCVQLAPHRIPLKEFTSLRKKPEDRSGLSPVWEYAWVQPENTPTQSQAEDMFWRLVSLRTSHSWVEELRENRLLSCVSDQRDLRIEFAHLVAKRQLHSVMEGLRQQSKSSAQDERGYGSVNLGTVQLKGERSSGLLTPRPLSLIPDLNSLRAVNPEPAFQLPCVLRLKIAE
ncbi:Hypothetical protein PHPALM_36345 [Phytophthora palmivora]|uniref:ATP-binding cassette (ABC) Superfamily n=1 Tax=Phytophthora palmivora TaxID=4796 RepID=A0A2P4X070_9STRA|nr:Hypothetical protein PHPALM_36345 [Phytophthora palmivora]